MGLNLQQVEWFRSNMNKVPLRDRERILELLEQHEDAVERKAAQTDFMTFVQRVWPAFISGRHHKIIAEKFNALAEGRIKRLMIHLPPRSTKSEFGSWLLPAWFLGRYPDKKVIQASNTAELAQGFGRKVRNLVDANEYREIFTEVQLRSDSKAAGRWDTNYSGQYFAIGVGGTMTGRGADLLIIDDPHSEGEAAQAEFNPEIYDKVYEWYTSGPRQRLQPGGSMVIIATRWSKRDLPGRIITESAQRGGDKWEVIEFPAIFPAEGTPGSPDYKPERALWPEYWPLEQMQALRTELPTSKWQAQYQQNPVSEGTAIVKRTWWRQWEKAKPPPCEFVLMSLDTAFEAHNRADYSAFTTWGIFYLPDEDGKDQANIILLNAFRDRLEFPDLKRVAMEQYRRWQPDSMIIEKKASGAPLIYEMRAAGMPVSEYTPVRGAAGKSNNKVARLNAVSDVFASGRVWAPNTQWAEEVIEEVASFPAGEHDDYVDSTSLALARFRNGGFITTDMDEPEEDYYPVRRAYY